MMTHTASAYAALETVQDAFALVATSANHARAAYKRSRTKANALAVALANEAFDEALEAVNRAHAAVDAAEILDSIDEARAAKAADTELSLF